MGSGIASEFDTLDNVMEAPGFDEHRDGKNAGSLRPAELTCWPSASSNWAPR
jgi:hypothetical protein